MANATWFTLNEEIVRIGLSRLSQLTNESAEAVRVGVVASPTVTYDLPFYGAAEIDLFYDWDGTSSDVPVSAGTYTLGRGTGADGQDQVTINSGVPADGTILHARTASGLLGTQLIRAIKEGQAIVSGALVGRGYTRPDVDATDVPDDMRGWAWTIAEWKLITGGVKRAPLGDALKQADLAYQEVVGREGSQDIYGHKHYGQLWWASPDWPLATISITDDGTGMVLADRRVFKQRVIEE